MTKRNNQYNKTNEDDNNQDNSKKPKTVHYVSSVVVEESVNKPSFFNPPPKMPDVAKVPRDLGGVRQLLEHFLEQFKNHDWFSKVPVHLQPVVLY